MSIDEAYNELQPFLLEDENINFAYKLVRDLIIFTNARIMFVDKQGMTGKKAEYLSVPYKSITRFSIESAGRFDRDSDLKIWISGSYDPIVKKMKKGAEILLEVQKAVAYYTMGSGPAK